jgi:hypothetical protein
MRQFDRGPHPPYLSVARVQKRTFRSPGEEARVLTGPAVKLEVSGATGYGC